MEIDQLTFEATEEIFSNGIVVKVALTGHTLTAVEQFYPVTMIDRTSDKEQASEGETITITAIDRSGYTFKN